MTQDGHFFGCEGRCSIIPAFTCEINAHCNLVNAGKCTNPPPGTCSNPPAGDCVGSNFHLSWSPVAGATGYDVVWGSVQQLSDPEQRFEGECIADNTTATSASSSYWGRADDPGTTAWFLVRAVTASGNGTYDEGGAQIGPRDAEIHACP